MSDKSRVAWPEAIADDDASLNWFVAKSSFLPKNRWKLLYQRTTGSSKRITMCSTNIHARTQMQLINSGGAQSTYIEQHRLFNQIRQQESYCSEAPSGQSRPASYLEYSQETASAPFMNRCGDVLLASGVYRQEGTRFHVGCRRKLKGYGIENLRIAPRSIMPRVTTGNTIAPCLIIGATAAAIMQADHKI